MADDTKRQRLPRKYLGIVFLVMSLVVLYFVTPGLVYGVWPGPLSDSFSMFYHPVDWLYERSETYAKFIRLQMRAFSNPDPRGPIDRFVVTTPEVPEQGMKRLGAGAESGVTGHTEKIDGE